MKKYIENIRVSVKKSGYTPTSDQIRQAINIVCPDGVNILENKALIVDETIKLINHSQESSITGATQTDSNLPNASELSMITGATLNDSSLSNTDDLPLPNTDVDTDVDTNVDEDSSEIVVSEGEKHELITVQSRALDINLSEAETVELCERIPDVFDDYESFVDSVTTAIKVFIDDKFDRQETQSVGNSISGLRRHIAKRQAQLDSKFATGLNDVRGDLEQIRSNLKSRQAAILERFKVSAG